MANLLVRAPVPHQDRCLQARKNPRSTRRKFRQVDIGSQKADGLISGAQSAPFISTPKGVIRSLGDTASQDLVDFSAKRELATHSDNGPEGRVEREHRMQSHRTPLTETAEEQLGSIPKQLRFLPHQRVQEKCSLA